MTELEVYEWQIGRFVFSVMRVDFLTLGIFVYRNRPEIRSFVSAGVSLFVVRFGLEIMRQGMEMAA